MRVIPQVTVPLLLSLALGVAPALASPADALPPHPRLSSSLRTDWNRFRHVAKGADRDAPRAVLVRATRELTDDELKVLEAQGVVWERLEGRVAHLGAFYGARVTPAVLTRLLADERVRGVSGFPRGVRPLPAVNPLGATHAWSHVDHVWPRRLDTGVRHQGTGVTLVDLDSATDVFHPLFFRADAGRYAWVDTNGNGTFDPDTDGVDVNGDGTVDAGETLRTLGGGVMDPTYMFTPAAGYQAALQFLYADADGSGAREYGAAAGFSESTPAYGEPLFVADDVNGNNALDADEQLLRLGSCKYKGVYRPSTNTAYMRGVDLVELPVNTDAGHGSGVGGILVGGLYRRTFVLGLAPDADVLHIVQDAAEGENAYGSPQYQQGLMAALAWAEQQGGRVFVHEYGTAVGEFADGSSDWEQMLDEMTGRGLVQATAAHNFAGNGGRTRLSLAPLETRDLPVVVLAPPDPRYAYYVMYSSVRWLGAAADVEVTLVTPDRTELPGSMDTQVGQHVSFGQQDGSSRGTGMVTLTYGYTDAAMTRYETPPAGSYALRLVNRTSAARELFIYVSEDSLYAYFVNVEAPRDDRSSMAWPSTADTAIAVGAFQVNDLTRVPLAGDLADYSGRGPRLDGQRTITVAAPADQYSAMPEGWQRGAGHYQVFNGTSGALPQVAAAVALLLQKEPGLTPLEVRDRLRSSALTDASTGAVPNDQWGGGRLDVHNLLFGSRAPVGSAPTLSVSAPACTRVGRVTTLDASASAVGREADGPLRFRFDADRDGTAEQDGPSATFTFTPAPMAARAVVSVETEDVLGRLSEQLVTVAVTADCPEQGGSGSSSGNSGGGGGGGSSGSAGDGPLPVPAGCGGCQEGGVPLTLGWLAGLLGMARRQRRRAFHATQRTGV